MTAQIKLPQHLLVQAQSALVHPGRDPIVLLARPVSLDLGFRDFGRFQLLDISWTGLGRIGEVALAAAPD